MARDPLRDDDGGREPKDKQEELIKSFFKRGAEFAEELLRENERLRFRALELEQRVRTLEIGGTSTDALRELLGRIDSLEQERENLLTRFASVEQENGDWKQRYSEIERENSNLAHLYVASYQLHSTLDLREVLQIIQEILLNLVGAKTFALYLIDDADQLLHPILSEGVSLESVPRQVVGEGLMGLVAKSGHAYLEGNLRPTAMDLSRPAVVTPLRIKGDIVGAIAIWDFLPQKASLVDVDVELFKLLTAHAAGALQAAKRNAEAGGRLLKLADVRELL